MSSYEADICRRLREAELVAFQNVSAEGWEPAVAGCHQNVDYWVRLSPGTVAVRGWVVFAGTGYDALLTAHSVVRSHDGRLFDITPLADGRPRQPMRFVEHLGDDRLFFEMVDQSKGAMGPVISCPECGGRLDCELTSD